MYGIQPNAYAQYPGYGGYQAYGQPAAPGPAVAPVASHQQVSSLSHDRMKPYPLTDRPGSAPSSQGGYWPNQQPAGQWGAYYGGQPGQSS